MQETEEILMHFGREMEQKLQPLIVKLLDVQFIMARIIQGILLDIILLEMIID